MALVAFIVSGAALGLTYRPSFLYDEIVRPVETTVIADTPPKASHLLTRTLPWPTRKMPATVSGDPCFSYTHSLMVPDNQGGVFIKAKGVNDQTIHPHDSHESILHYRTDGSISVVFADNYSDFGLTYGVMAINSRSTLYVKGGDFSKKLSRKIFYVPVGRIVDFPKNQTVQPYIGMSPDFQINLLDHCSELPQLCEGKKIDFNSLCHVSVDANDNLYIGLELPGPRWSLEDHVQVMLLKIEPSEKVVHVGNFPRLRIDPRTNTIINIPDPGDAYFPRSIDFSLAVDRQGNVFIHQYNALLEFPKQQEGYGPVQVVRTMNSEATYRSIASGPDGIIYYLDRKEQAAWKILPNFDLELLLGIPHQLGFSMGTGAETRFKKAIELVCDAQGRLFIYDEENEAIFVYK
jgi:hypothetical protein